MMRQRLIHTLLFALGAVLLAGCGGLPASALEQGIDQPGEPQRQPDKG